MIQNVVRVIVPSHEALSVSMNVDMQVVNLYMELLKERETRTPNHRPKCHFFNSFFYAKVSKTDYC